MAGPYGPPGSTDRGQCMSRTSRLCTPNRVILIEAPHTLPTEPIREGCRHAIRPANELKKGAAWHGDHGAVLSGIPKSFPRLEAAPGFEPGIRALQARALPLGYAATDRARHPAGRRRIGVTRSGAHVNSGAPLELRLARGRLGDELAPYRSTKRAIDPPKKSSRTSLVAFESCSLKVSNGVFPPSGCG